MRSPFALTLAAIVAAPALAGAEEAAGDTSGVITGSFGFVEILPEAPPAGTTIELREGWIRVEEVPEGEEPGSGSYAVIRAEVLQAQSQQPGTEQPGWNQQQPGMEQPGWNQQQPGMQQPGWNQQQPGMQPPGWSQQQPGMQPPGAAGRRPTGQELGLGACYEQREAYVRELFRIAGIRDVEHPLALLDALNFTPGLSPWVRLNLFGMPTGGPWAGVTWIEPVRPLAWDDGLRYVARDLERCMRAELGFDDRLVDPALEQPAQQQAAPMRAPAPAEPPAPRRGLTL